MSRFDKLHALVDRHRDEVPSSRIAKGRAAFLDATERNPTRRSMNLGLLAAAAAAVVLGSSGYWVLRSRATEKMATPVPLPASRGERLELPASGPASLELESGVTAELSAGTLAYRTEPASGERRITLERGRLRLSIDSCPARASGRCWRAGTK